MPLGPNYDGHRAKSSIGKTFSVIQSVAKDPVSRCTYGLLGTKWILRYALDDS